MQPRIRVTRPYPDRQPVLIRQPEPAPVSGLFVVAVLSIVLAVVGALWWLW